MVFNSKHSFVHPSEVERSKVYIPDAVIDFLETDVFTSQGVGDAHPVFIPANATVATDEPDLEVSRIFDWGQLPG